MSESKAIREVTIVNPQGLHARPAYLFAELAGTFDSTIELVKDGERIDGKSILSILTLAAVEGSHLSVEATGADAEQAIAALADLVQAGFPGGEPAADPN